MKKYYKLIEKINTDKFSNRVAGLEDENIFNSVSEGPVDALDELNDEVESQIDEESMFSDVEIEEDEFYEEDEWSEVKKDQDAHDSKDPEDCINLMELVSCYTNNYRKEFVKIADDKILEGTGDFSKHFLYKELEEVFATVSSVLNDQKSEYLDNIKTARTMLSNKKKMTMICGTKTAPFLYEGLQLAYIQQIHNLLMAMPYTLKLKETFINAIEAIGLDKDIKFVNRVLKDYIEADSVLGTKIIFQDAEKSEITGKNNELNETVYADSDIISEGVDSIVSDFEYAGESIANLIEIKANKAL
ncbi:MAG: hypothetical protein ACRCX2_24930, partial [Paraclostridium sp.]